MTFPSTSAPTNTAISSLTTTHNIAMPAVVNAGDLLIIVIVFNGTPTITSDISAWTLVKDYNPTISMRVYKKIANGAEGGTTVAFTTSGPIQCAASVYRVTGASGNVEVSTGATGSTTHPDPDNLSPSWGAKDTLWITAAEIQAGTSMSGISGWSSGGVVNYGGRFQTCWLAQNTASQNPGTYTVGFSTTWEAFTIGVEPANPTISDCSPSSFQDADTGIVLTGINFGASQGLGSVKLSPTNDVNDAGAIDQIITSWGDTSITFTVDATGLTPGTIYAFVTDNAGNSGTSGFSITLLASNPVITDVNPHTFKENDHVTITGTTFGASQGNGKVELADSGVYNAATKVQQNVSNWSDIEINIIVHRGSLPAGSVWVFVTNDSGNTSGDPPDPSNPPGGSTTLEPALSPIVRHNLSTKVLLEEIYAILDGHTVVPPTAARSEYWLLQQIGKIQGANFTSGLRSREDNFIRLYENLTGRTYNGARSVEMILRRIEADV